MSIATAAEFGMAPLLLPNGQEVWVRRDAPTLAAAMGKGSANAQIVATRGLQQLAAEVSGTSGGSLGPGIPIAPTNQDTIDPRRYDYPVGFNQQQTPRAYEPASFATLRSFVRNYDIARLAEQKRVDELKALDWQVRPRQVDGQTRKEAKDHAKTLEGAIDAATEFFRSPNGEDQWGTWASQWLHDLFQIDAATIYLRPSRAGGLYGLEIVDGATIRPIIDLYGRIPSPPEPAYGQFIKGQTWTVFSSDEIIYQPYWQEADSPYGNPPIEWVLLTVNRALRRQTLDLSLYTEGNLPPALFKLPEGVSDVKFIADLQDAFDAINVGNDAQRARMKFVPGGPGAGLERINPEPKNDAEEWLMHVTCAAFGVDPQELGFVARSSGLGGKGMAERSESSSRRRDKGVAKHLGGILTAVLNGPLGQPELEFAFLGLDDAEDLLTTAQANKVYVDMGALSADEVREDVLDKDPIGLEAYIATGTTAVLVSEFLKPPEPTPAALLGPGPKLLGPGDQAGGDQPPDPNAPDDGSDTIAKVAGDLDRWERKALKAVRAGRSGAVPFTSDVLSTLRRDAILGELAKASTVIGVRAAFRLAKAGASADPLPVSSSRIGFGPYSPSTSQTRADGSSPGSASPRPRYP